MSSQILHLSGPQAPALDVNEALQDAGYNVENAALDPAQAAKAAGASSPDLVLVDLGIDAGRGKQILDALAKDVRFRDLPILVMAGAAVAGCVIATILNGKKTPERTIRSSHDLLGQIDAEIRSAGSVSGGVSDRGTVTVDVEALELPGLDDGEPTERYAADAARLAELERKMGLAAASVLPAAFARSTAEVGSEMLVEQGRQLFEILMKDEALIDDEDLDDLKDEIAKNLRDDLEHGDGASHAEDVSFAARVITPLWIQLLHAAVERGGPLPLDDALLPTSEHLDDKIDALLHSCRTLGLAADDVRATLSRFAELLDPESSQPLTLGLELQANDGVWCVAETRQMATASRSQ